MVRPWRNKKTGKVYELISFGIDVTNARDGLQVAIYTAGEGTMFVRELTEFYEKFEEVK